MAFIGSISAEGCSLLPHKREPEKRQRFRRAGPTNQGLLALDNPKAEVEAQKMLAAALNAFFRFSDSKAPQSLRDSSPQGSGCSR